MCVIRLTRAPMKKAGRVSRVVLIVHCFLLFEYDQPSYVYPGQDLQLNCELQAFS